MPNRSVDKAGGAAPAGAEREALRRDIIAQAGEIGSRGPDLSEDEAGTLVDEAFAEIRGRRERNRFQFGGSQGQRGRTRWCVRRGPLAP